MEARAIVEIHEVDGVDGVVFVAVLILILILVIAVLNLMLASIDRAVILAILNENPNVAVAVYYPSYVAV